MMQRLLIPLLTTLAVTDAKLRGTNFEDLKRRATNPVLRSEIRGKTLAELGVNRRIVEVDEAQAPSVVKGAASPAIVKGDNADNAGRLLQSTKGGTIQFFSVYDEFGPAVSKVGETAGLNGHIYDFSKYGSGNLTEDDVIGALKASCSVVGSDYDHFCTFEILIVDERGQSFGSVIASGTVDFEEGQGGYLMVEAAGEAYKEYNGGIFTLTYQAIGEVTVITGEISLS